MSDFPERGVAIVTGGSGGVGGAVSRALAAAGSDVVLTYHRNEAAARKTVEAIEAAGRQAEAVSVDLRDEAAVADFIAKSAERHRGIHTLVTAHGPFVNMRFISKISPSLFRESMEADVFGAFNVFHAVIPYLRESKGSIVSMVTTAVGRAAKKDILSVAPKASIAALVRGIALEEGKFGVRANMIGVGLLTDGMHQALVNAGGLTPEIEAIARRRISLGHLGTSEEIAHATVFLASSKAKWISSQLLMVDGGMTG
jgi:NAD(P)-dependent dehydrogenase (short-subunit alcohol dehydrogenase family)